MSKGYWAGDAIATGLELVGEIHSHGATIDRLIEMRKRADEWAAAYKDLEAGNAANLAEKMALRKALARYDPKHPLLTNAHLKERIHKAAEQVLALSGSSWIDVGNVGRDFKY